MIVVRLSRTGAKKKPFYHIVVCNKRSKRDGKYIEKLGYYNPIAKGDAVDLKINSERFAYWKSVGAQVSDRVNIIYNKSLKGSGAITSDVSESTEIIN